VQITFDINALSLEDAEDLEEYTGIPVMKLSAALEAGAVPTKVLTAMVWILKRREDPSFTLAAARALRFNDLEVELPKAGAAVAAAPGSPG